MENNFENTVVTEETASPAANIVDKVKAAVTGIVSKVKADPKGFGVKLGAIVLAAVIAIVAVFVVIGAATNNYKTPIKVMQKYDNKKTYYDESETMVAMLNGFCEKEIKAYVKLMKSGEDYKDELADAKEDFKDTIADLKEEYGSNYKYTYKVVEKEKIDKDDLKDLRDNLRDLADKYEDALVALDEYESEDWEELADQMGLDGNKSKAKKIKDIMKGIRKELKGAKVSAGYELEVVKTLKGSELDEPVETEKTIYVYKVNGRWVSSEALSVVAMFAYMGSEF